MVNMNIVILIFLVMVDIGTSVNCANDFSIKKFNCETPDKSLLVADCSYKDNQISVKLNFLKPQNNLIVRIR